MILDRWTSLMSCYVKVCGSVISCFILFCPPVSCLAYHFLPLCDSSPIFTAHFVPQVNQPLCHTSSSVCVLPAVFVSLSVLFPSACSCVMSLSLFFCFRILFLVFYLVFVLHFYFCTTLILDSMVFGLLVKACFLFLTLPAS